MGIETLRPSADGDYRSLNNQLGYPPDYIHVDEEVADDGATWVFIDSLTQVKDAYQLADTQIPQGAAIDSVRVYFRVQCNGNKYYQPFLRLSGAETAGTEILPGGAQTYTTFSEVLSRPGGGSWQLSDLNSLQVCIGLRSKISGHYCRCTQTYVEVSYTIVTARTSSDTGAGADASAPLLAALTDSDTASGAEAPPTTGLALSETGTGAEASSLDKDLSATERGQGSDSLTAKIERPTTGGGMKLWT